MKKYYTTEDYKKWNRIHREYKDSRRKRINNKYDNYNELNTINFIKKKIDKYAAQHIKYILLNEKSDFNLDKLYHDYKFELDYNSSILVPSNFSLVEDPEGSFNFIKQLLYSVILKRFTVIKINYENCKNVDVGAQVFLDIILRGFLDIKYKTKDFKYKVLNFQTIEGEKIYNDNIKKVLFSIGSASILINKTYKFKDIIPYPLCHFQRNTSKSKNSKYTEDRKSTDTSKLVDYVINSLNRIGKSLTADKIHNLSVVIGEILINAEEHSTFQQRFSIGYFQEITEQDKHYGIFKLAILNFGQTIYEKFNDEYCKNTEIVRQMKILSNKYKRRNLFSKNIFSESTLWTLYSLQDGVTSTDPNIYSRRGNGSIQFIEKFFSFSENNNNNTYNSSKLVIISGNSRILFDGNYDIIVVNKEGHEFKMMTFNRENDIETIPDSNYVKDDKNYFPGTIISLKIILNDDDFVNINKDKTYE